MERRLVWTTWERWRTVHPETRVLSEETGYVRNYDDDPYGSYNPRGGYYETGPPARSLMHEDDRFHPKTVVIGARGAGGAAAVAKDTLRERGVITIDTALEPGTTYTFAYDETLDTGYAYRNPDRESVDYLKFRR